MTAPTAQTTLEDLGVSEEETVVLSRQAVSRANFKGPLEGLRKRDKLGTLVWRLMQENPRFNVMPATDMAWIVKYILDRDIPPPEPKKKRDRKKMVKVDPEVVKKALADARRNRIDKSTEGANEANPH